MVYNKQGIFYIKEKLSKNREINGLRRGYTLWLTGLSASGKSTISGALIRRLTGHMERLVHVIDGDYMRRTINRDLGYSKADRNLASERIAHVAKILNDCGVVCIVSNISQDRDVRSLIRNIVGECILVFVDTPLEVCIGRDYKDQYKKALNGEIEDFVGIHHEYERPEDAEIAIDTLSMTPEDAAERIFQYLKSHGLTDK